ncbi:Ig-like domain-containing protein [Rheinheimera sp. KL1]|uniref:Ig-like domain-containing protein n=1 Tax=Rheinheimera sp. KL1 TaxID=1635005 RepID=UPI0006A971F1|nr:Ig-like domain-containing protein [Rheinheimera sp. KL1]
MNKTLLSGLIGLLMPLGGYASMASRNQPVVPTPQWLPASLLDLKAKETAQASPVEHAPQLTQGQQVRELVIIDADVPDKATLYRSLKPGVDVVELNDVQDGMLQLQQVLQNYSGLQAVHLVSHAEQGKILLGNSSIDSILLSEHPDLLRQLNQSVVAGGDLLLYGCDLAAGAQGQELLELFSSATHLDVAASSDKTGAADLGGDWDLEIQQGDIQSTLAFSPKALADFSSVLATKTYIDTDFCSSNCFNSSLGFTSTDTDIRFTGSANVYAYNDTTGQSFYLDFSQNGPSGHLDFAANDEVVSFELTQIRFGTNNGASCSSAEVKGYTSSGSETDTFTLSGAGPTAITLTNIAGKQLTHFRVIASGCTNPDVFQALRIVDFTVDNKKLLPQISNATYNVATQTLAVTATNLTSGDTIDVSKLTITGEGGTTHTLTSGNVTASSSTAFSVTLNATDQTALHPILNKVGTVSTGNTTFNLAGAEDWNSSVTAGNSVDATNALTVSNVPAPTVTSATYDADTGVLALSGTGLLKRSGATNDIIANKLTLTGEGGATYTLTDTANVEISSGTNASVTLSATDKAGVNLMVNKNGTSSTSGTTYNLAAAEDWNNGADAAVVIADTTGNGITVSNVAIPQLTSSSYNASTGALVLTGTGFLRKSGATNDIDASMFTFTVEGGGSYSLTDTADVEVTSGTSATLTLSATDRAALGMSINKNGTASTGGTTYNIAAAEDWAAGADAAVNVADLTGNGITVSNVSVPAITSAAYNAVTGALVVSGSNFLQLSGANNDIDVSKLSISGDASSYSLTSGSVEISSATTFSVTLNGTDRTALVSRINKNGTSSAGSVTYNLAAAEDWAAGADAAVSVADLTSNGITASGVPAIVTSVTASTADGAYTASDTVTVQVNFSANVTVAGTPQLTLDTGATDRAIDFSGGSGTSTLTFTYTVQAGDTSSDLDYVSVNALSLNSGTIQDGSAVDAVLTLPTPGAAGSLGANKALVIDTTAPNAPSTPDLATASDSGASSTDNITNDTTPTLTGTAEAGSTVTLYDTDGVTSLGSAAATGGSWSITVSPALSEGSHTLTAKARDAAGNQSAASSGLSVTIDTTAPAKPATPDLADASDSGDSNSDNLTKLQNITLQGASNAVEANATVRARSSLDGGLTDVGADSNGAYSLNLTGLSAGNQNLVVMATDIAGNQSVDSDPLAIVIDTTAPAISSVSFDQDPITDANQAGVSFTLSGAETGATAEYSINSNSGGVAVNDSFVVASAGQQIIAVDVSGLNDGTLTLSLTLTDAAGNVSTPAVTDTVIKDANVPAITTVTIADGNYKAGETIDFTVTFDDTVTVTGTDSTLGIEIGGSNLVAGYFSGTGSSSLTYRYTVLAGQNTDSSGIAVLANSLILNTTTIRDSGNNDAVLTFAGTNNDNAQVDTTDPVATVVTDPAAAVFVNAASYEIKGTHSGIGVTVNLYVDDNNDGAADDPVNDIGHAIVDADGNWSIPNVALTADTAHNYVVVAEDAAGNESVAVDVPTITEDSIAPVAVAITTPATVVSVSTSTQLIEGTHSEDGVTVELFADSDNDGIADNSTVLASAEVGAVTTGIWSFAAPLTTNTENNFVVIAKDKAGNVSTAADVVTITQDAVAPVVTVTALTTADTTPALAGTVDDATATLSLTVAGQTLTLTNNGNGSWTLADNQLTALTNGVYDVQVTATDAQGNIGTDASSNELTIDLLAPAGYSASIVQERINATNQAAMSFVFAGAEVGSSYNYSVSDGTNSVTGSGTVSSATQQVAGINVTALAEGTLQLSVTLTDTLGNVGAAATDTVLKRYNSEPVNPGNSTASVEEDTTLRITLAVQDPENDTLTYELVTQPAHGTAVVQGSQLIYTPELNYNGTDSISYIASDSEFSTQTATIAITVTAVNDNPLAEDDSYSLQRVESNQYQLAVLANDSDVDGDTLTIDGASTSVGTVVFTAQGLTLTTPDLYVGPVSLRYTLTDGNGGRDTADVNLIIEGGAASNLPVITVPADIEVNATALFTRVPLGTATAVDRNGRRLRVSLINGSLFFAPGEHIVYWQATDADGNTATKAQRVRVNPLVSLSKDQLVTEGSEVEVQVILNGPAPVYPVSVPYTVSGSAGANDHTLVSGVAEISSGLSTTIRFNVLEDALADSPEDIVITLDSSVNRGSKRSSRIVVSDANVAPVVSLQVQQNGENRLTVSESDGVVTVTATVTDANPQDQITGVWDFGRLTNATSDQSQLSFDPTEQGPGLYLVSYTATDNGTPNLSVTSRVFIVLRPNLPTLGTADTDGDLVPDNQEGFADSDGDGIPDYQDAINECNVMPTELLGQTQFVAEGDPGVCLRLGTVAAQTDAGGLQIAKDAVVTDNVAVNIGGIFDFIAYGLPEQGKSYSLVIPQRLPVPANAVYRKFSDVTGWVDFVSNERNSVSSTAGERGFCPPPGDAVWTEGLTEGHWCVQVTVEDGGPNDADGIANSAIVDPGGVAVVLNGNNLPVAVADEASVRVDTSVDINVLANDSDVDGDALTVNQAISSFGTVTILPDQQLSYTPNPDFVGVDTVIYSITDGKGGTASSEVVVDVFSNNAPVAVNDTASTDDRSPLLIAVLANDTDADGDVLTVTAASAQEGTVSIEADQRLRYTPKAGFNGVDTISYTVTDSSGDSATGSVSVTVRAYQDVVVDNKSSGGSMSWWMGMVLAGAVMLRRRSVMGVAAVALLAFSPWSQGQDWYLQGSVGHSTADQKQNRLVEELPSGTITAFDDSDSLYGITLGYKLHPYFAVEMGYQDLGEASAQLSGDSLTPEQYHELVKAVSPVLVDGWTAAARFALWQNDVWNVEVPVGLFRWDSEIESSRGNSTLYSKTNGTDWFLGVQLNYSLSDNLKFGLGYQQLELDANDVSSWLLSVRYEF